VHAFDHDPDPATGAAGRVLLETGGPDGVADGLTVDDEGCLWTGDVGRRAGAPLVPRRRAAGRRRGGVANTSSCAFAGDLLVVSTARREDRGARRGRLFTVRPGVSGPPASPYRGPLWGFRAV
jgi:sugar lactone lactonase YvrE